MKILIVGAGKTTREILRRLGEAWSVTLVDIVSDRLNLLKKNFKQVAKTVLGDASSLITLKEANLENQDFVVGVTNHDDVNLEVCRLAKERGIKNIVALVNDSLNLKEFDRLNVRPVCWSYLAAREIELCLENPRLFVTTIGGGKGEIMEIEVSRYAPVVGKKIREFRARNWLIAAIYRKGELIIPHGDTIIQSNDWITIIGHPDLYQAISHLFKYQEPSFPLVYGQNILIPVEDIEIFEDALSEAFYLIRNTRAQKAVILVPKELEETISKKVQKIEEPREVEIRIFREKMEHTLITITYHESVGCVLIPPPSPGILDRIFSHSRVIPLVHKLGSPLLVFKATYPYNQILVPYNATQSSALALEIAIDIARQTDASISVVVVLEPTFIRGEESSGWAEDVLDHAREIAQIHKFPIKEIKLEGNPVKEVTKLAENYDLLILGSTTQSVPFLKPHIGELLIEKSPCSVMVVAY